MLGSQRVWPRLQHGDRTVRIFFGQFAGSVFVRAENDALGVQPVALADNNSVGGSNGFDNIVVADWLAQITANHVSPLNS